VDVRPRNLRYFVTVAAELRLSCAAERLQFVDAAVEVASKAEHEPALETG